MNKILAAALLLSATITTPAYAAKVIPAPAAKATPVSATNTPYYAGVLVGDAYFGVFAGYQIDKMWSAEVQYAKANVPDVSGTLGGVPFSTKINSSNITVSAVALFPITQVPNLSVFGKAGVERNSTEVTMTSGTVTTSISTSGIKLAAGAGVQYDLNKNISGRAGIGLLVDGDHKELYIAGIYKF